MLNQLKKLHVYMACMIIAVLMSAMPASATIDLPGTFDVSALVTDFWDVAYPALLIVLGVWLAVIIIKFILKIIRRVFR